MPKTYLIKSFILCYNLGMLKIVSAPNGMLALPAEKVEKIDKSILSLLKEMKQTLLAAKDPEGVGLAAPQVGKSLQIFIAKPTPKSPILVFINPVIEEISKDLIPLERPKKSSSPKKLEGCLSLLNIWGTVLRSPQLTLSFMDESGKYQKKKFTGFMATIIQHEIDHLNGVLFPKRVLEQKGKLYKSHKNEKGEDEFDEIEL